MTRGRPTRTCAHPPRSSFIAFQGKNGATLWCCSHCGKEDVWRDGWEFFGAYECRCCWAPEIYAVLCSDVCRRAYQPKNPKVALMVMEARD